MPYNAEKGKCPNCGKGLFLSDMLGFHQAMGEGSAPHSVASDYMSVQETLLVFTGTRYFWENSIDTLPDRSREERSVLGSLGIDR
jgi:hypothetical protein